MGEAGWLGGWLPRVLQPFAPASLGKRKTPSNTNPDGSPLSIFPRNGNTYKRQRLGTLTAARGTQTVRPQQQVLHCRPHQQTQQQTFHEKQQQQSTQLNVSKNSQKAFQHSGDRIARNKLSSSRRGQGSCCVESDASFASVPSDDEVKKTQAYLEKRKVRGIARTYGASHVRLKWGGLETEARLQERQSEQQQEAPPGSSHQLPRKRQHPAFSSLLSWRTMGAKGERPKAFSVTKGAITAPATVARPDGRTASLLPMCHAISRLNPSPDKSVDFASGAACALTSTSSSSTLPVISERSSSVIKSRSTSALPALSSACDGVLRTLTTSCTSSKTSKEEGRQKKLQRQLLPEHEQRQHQQRGVQMRQGSGPLISRDEHFVHFKFPEERPGVANNSNRSKNQGLLGSNSYLQGNSTLLPLHDYLHMQQARAESLGRNGVLASRECQRDFEDDCSGIARAIGSSQNLFCSPKKEDCAFVDSGGLIFGHRVLRPLVSKDPTENYDAFLDILRHAKKHCEPDTLELLMADKELLYYTRGSHHPQIALRSQNHQLQPQEQHMQQRPQQKQQLLAGARPDWALPDALLASLKAQREVDPFSVFGDAPPELLLEEIYERDHYNATGARTRATHPVMAKLEQRLFVDAAATRSGGSTQQLGVSGVALEKGKEKGGLTAETWKNVSLPALLSWWQRDSAVELDWRHDPLTAEDCSWYLQTLGATRDLTDVVTLKQPCFCPTPPPERGWSWTDSRQVLRRRLTAGSLLALKAQVSSGLSPSPSRRHARDNPNANTLSNSHLPRTRAAAAVRLRASGAFSVLSPITPGIRRRRRLKGAGATLVAAGRGLTRRKDRFVSPVGSPFGVSAPCARVPGKAGTEASFAELPAAEVASSGPASPSDSAASLQKKDGLSGELSRLLTDAQRRLNSLAERMRSRSRPPLGAIATAAPSHNLQRINSTHTSSSSNRNSGGDSSTRAMSASGVLTRMQSLGREKRPGVIGSSLKMLPGVNLPQGSPRRELLAAGRRPHPMQFDNSVAACGSYYSSSNLPLLGRERGPTSSIDGARGILGDARSLERADPSVGDVVI